MVDLLLIIRMIRYGRFCHYTLPGSCDNFRLSLHESTIRTLLHVIEMDGIGYRLCRCYSNGEVLKGSKSLNVRPIIDAVAPSRRRRHCVR